MVNLTVLFLLTEVYNRAIICNRIVTVCEKICSNKGVFAGGHMRKEPDYLCLLPQNWEYVH